MNLELIIKDNIVEKFNYDISANKELYHPIIGITYDIQRIVFMLMDKLYDKCNLNLDEMKSVFELICKTGLNSNDYEDYLKYRIEKETEESLYELCLQIYEEKLIENDINEDVLFKTAKHFHSTIPFSFKKVDENILLYFDELLLFDFSLNKLVESFDEYCVLVQLFLTIIYDKVFGDDNTARTSDLYNEIHEKLAIFV